MNQLTILYEDPHIIVCTKPSGVPVQTKSIRTPDMVSMLTNHLCSSGKKDGRTPYLAVIHRLDQPVEGILVFAKTPFAAKELNKQLQSDTFGKYYLAVACGVPESKAGTLTDYLVKDGRSNTSRVCTASEPQAKKAELTYSIRKTSEEHGLSLVEVKLKTGRHHQIRVQFSHAGMPLWGDNKYNPDFANKKEFAPVALCAYKLQFTHPKTKKLMQFEIEPANPVFQKL